MGIIITDKAKEYVISISEDKKKMTINGQEHIIRDWDYVRQRMGGEGDTKSQDILTMLKIAKEIIRQDPRHWNFHHMSAYDKEHTNEMYIRELNGFPRYDDGAAYGYGQQVFRFDGDTTGCHNVMSGMTQKLASQIAGELNNAVEFGYSWARNVITHCRREFDFEECLRDYKLIGEKK